MSDSVVTVKIPMVRDSHNSDPRNSVVFDIGDKYVDIRFEETDREVTVRTEDLIVLAAVLRAL